MPDEEKQYTRQDLVTLSAAVSRSLLGQALGMSAYQGDRDYYKTLGYPRSLDINQLVFRYERQDIAGRVVDLPAQDTWRKPPQVAEGEEADVTEFERAWQALAERLHVWNYLMRVDKLSGIGHYGVLLVGVRDGPLNQAVKKGALKGPQDVLYLRPFSEAKASIAAFDEESSSPRYGLPLTYDIHIREDRAPVSVHWTRVLHVAEGKRDSEVYGTPRLERIYDRLDDLIKVVGGAAEAAWLNMRPGTLLTTREGYAFPDDADFASQVDEEVFKYLHDVARMMRLEGVDAKQIGSSEVPNIESLFDACIGLISAASGIPQRVLLGSAKGELSAAQEDMRQWAGEIAARQKGYAEPEILRPFISLMQWYGVLPETPDGYDVGTPDENGEYHWPPIVQLTAAEQAELRDRMSQAVRNLANPFTGEFPLLPGEVRELLGYNAEPSDEMLTNALAVNAVSGAASHVAETVYRACPLCGAGTAYHYPGHGPLLVCAGCGKTYDPEVE